MQKGQLLNGVKAEVSSGDTATESKGKAAAKSTRRKINFLVCVAEKPADGVGSGVGSGEAATKSKGKAAAMSSGKKIIFFYFLFNFSMCSREIS